MVAEPWGGGKRLGYYYVRMTDGCLKCGTGHRCNGDREVDPGSPGIMEIKQYKICA